jgi:kanamycin kinase
VADGTAVPVPARLREQYREWRWSVEWVQEAGGGVVHRLESASGEVWFLKLASGPRTLRLQPEADRMRWAQCYIQVPQVIDCSTDDGVDWLLTVGLPGLSGVAPEHLAQPMLTIPASARGLRRLHETLPVNACPFDFRLDAAIAHVQRRAEAGLIVPGKDFEAEFKDLSLNEALTMLERERPSSEDLVVCHGDYCFPNVMLENGEVTGYVDLGELGVADRWYDIAVACWSTNWNWHRGDTYEEVFLKAYGVERDEARMRYYRLLWCLTS